MNTFIYALNGYILPALLIICGLTLSFKIKLHKILNPKRFYKTISEASLEKDKISSQKALCTALAGTLGVGNIAGVASAITSGGAGAVFWMWLGALLSMSIKYAEVSLAIKYRTYKSDKGYVGGAMYTMKESLKTKIGAKNAYVLGGIFAILCIINSFIMGNLIQSNAAGGVSGNGGKYIGILLSFALLLTALIGVRKITNLTFYIIPPLSAVYIILSLAVMIRNYNLIPNVITNIIKCAFSSQAVTGGLYGLGIKEAVRFGVTRGIFSNEAGCGTAPSAHASAIVKSPHHQGCFGIFEVIADTLILCSMTAFVILISDSQFGTNISSNGVKMTLEAFGNLLGKWAYFIVGISVILFAFATIIAQLYYGNVAINYFTTKKSPRIAFIIISVVLCYIGPMFDTSKIWWIADLTIGVMTIINTTVILFLKDEVKSIAEVDK